MKTSKHILAPTPLDLAALDQVIGGCRLAQVPVHEPVQRSSRDLGAMNDAWASLSSSGAFDHEGLATAFMQAHTEPSHVGDPRLDAQAPHGSHTSDARLDAPPELHCGTTTPAETSDRSTATDEATDGTVGQAPVELHCGTTGPSTDDRVSVSAPSGDGCAEHCATTIEAPEHLEPTYCSGMQSEPMQPTSIG